MSRRGRKQIMSQGSSFKQRFFFDEVTLIALHVCEPDHELTPQQDKAWNKLKEFLRKQTYTILCTRQGFQNFITYIIERDRETKFFGELREKRKEFQGDLYLTDDCYLKPTKSLARQNWKP